MRTAAYAATAALMAGGALAGAGQASAATTAAAPSAHAAGGAPVAVTVSRIGGTAATADGGVSAQSACGVSAYGHQGYAVCGSHGFAYDWGGGNIEYFVVGTNYSIYHIWKGASGWKSLGGTASSSQPGAWDARDSVGSVGVSTWGTDNKCWWRPRGNGSWPGGWRRC